MYTNGFQFSQVQCIKCRTLLDILDEMNKEWYDWKFCPGCPEFKKWYHKKIKTDFYKLIRFALTGKEDGINVIDILMLLGKKESIQRIKNCINSYNKYG